MIKRCVSLLFVIVLLFGVGFVLAQDGNFGTDQVVDNADDSSVVDESVVDPGADNLETDGVVDGVLDDEPLVDESASNEAKLIREAEGFDEEFDVDAGLVPGDFFYFLDGIIDSREEKIAEMRITAERCNEGDEDACDALEIAYEKYKEHADEYEEQVSPDERDEAERSSRAIRGVVVREIAKNAPPGLKDELVRDIVNRESRIQTAAELASKIKELCVQLSELDPIEFDRVCGLREDSKPWERRLHDDLTDEQKKEAREFGEILSSCMRTSGEDCRCDDIKFVKMQEMCNIAAPLARVCGDFGYRDEDDFDNDDDDYEEEESPEVEAACDELDSLEFPDMPDYLEEIVERLEEQYGDDNYDNHIPGPCRDAGIDGRDPGDRDECMRIMIFDVGGDGDNEIPTECRSALQDAFDDGVRSEKKFRQICEGIMFDREAPQECIDAGVTSPRECGRLMEELGFGGRDDRDHRGPDCRGIDNPEERLKCFDGFDGRDFEDRSRDDYRRDFDDRYDDYRQDRRT